LECNESSQRHASGNDITSAVPDDGDQSNGGNEVEHGKEERPEPDGIDVLLQVPPVDVPKLIDLVVLAGKGTYDSHTGHVFLQHGGDLRLLLLDGTIRRTHPGAKLADSDHQKWQGGEDNQRESQVHRKHHDEHTKEPEHGECDVHEAEPQKTAHSVYVLRGALHELASL